jgi:hypothetical protein
MMHGLKRCDSLDTKHIVHKTSGRFPYFGVNSERQCF